MMRIRQSFKDFEKPVFKNDYGTAITYNKHQPFEGMGTDGNPPDEAKRRHYKVSKNDSGWMKECDRKHDIPYKCPPLLKHRDESILNKGSNFITIVGKSGTGKTVLLDHIVPKFKVMNIIVCSLIKDNEVHETIADWADEHDIDCCVVNTLERAVQAVDIAKAKFLAQPPEERYKYHTLLVFDDFSKFKTGRDNPLNNFAIQAYSTLRNCGFSMIFVTQDYSNIPTLVRANLSHVYMFPFTNFHGLLQLKLDINSNLNPEVMSSAADGVENENKRFSFVSKMTKNDKEVDDKNKEVEEEPEASTTTSSRKRKRQSNSKKRPIKKRKLGLGTVNKLQSVSKLKDGSSSSVKKEPYRYRTSKMLPEFNRLWDGVSARINAEPFTFCLFKYPDSVYINMKKIS